MCLRLLSSSAQIQSLHASCSAPGRAAWSICVCCCFSCLRGRSNVSRTLSASPQFEECHIPPAYSLLQTAARFLDLASLPHAPPKLQDIEDFWIQLVFQFLCMLNRCAATSAAAVSGTRHTLRVTDTRAAHKSDRSRAHLCLPQMRVDRPRAVMCCAKAPI